MRNPKYRSFTLELIFILLLSASFISAQEKSSTTDLLREKSWPHLNYALYFTSRDIDSLLTDQDQFQKTIDYFAPIKYRHVYLEGTSRGEINVSLLKHIADKFRAMGIRVSGAMVPVGTQGALTYTNQKDLAAIQKRMSVLAGIFDDIIIDDWLFTLATDPKSVRERGNQTWAEYRTKLLLKQSKKHILDPARRVNPNVKVIIKYPNWYEGFGENGYDVYNETHLFDKMAVGIETRNRMTHDQHIPIYSGYIFQKWYSSVDTSKWIGSWLDNYDMKGDYNDYTAQVWQAVLAKAPEIIIWCAGQLYKTGPSSDVYPYFCEMLPEYNRIAGMLSGPSHGVPIYLPYGSTGEYNIFGYLGMAGIPLEPVARFPVESQNAIFAIHSLKDPGLANKMLDRLHRGKDLFMTWGLWKKLRDTEFKNTLNLVDEGGSVTSDEFRVREGWFREDLIRADKPFTFPRIETTTWPYARDVALERDDYDFGVLLNVPYLNGRIHVLNMPDNSYDLLRLPARALNLIRHVFVKELGVELNGPGGVAMYLIGDKQHVLYNLSDDTAAMTLRFTRKIPVYGWYEAVNNKELGVKQDTTHVRFGGPVVSDVAVSLKPFEIVVIQAP
jgi:hypothetical protein